MPEKQNHGRQLEVDRLLDRALAKYPGEPLPGFQSRMVRRLRGQKEPSIAEIFGWRRPISATVLVTSLALTAAASILIGLHLGHRRENAIWQQRIVALTEATLAKQGTSSSAVASAIATPSDTACISRTEKPLAVHRSRRHAAQFPSPTPLSSQERALAMIARNGSPELLSSLIHPKSATEDLSESSMAKEKHNPTN